MQSDQELYCHQIGKLHINIDSAASDQNAQTERLKSRVTQSAYGIGTIFALHSS